MAQGRLWIRDHGLALALFGAFGIFLLAQSLTGWNAHNEDLADHGRSSISYATYLTTGHFVEATFENWESEFLQMARLRAAHRLPRPAGFGGVEAPEDDDAVDEDPREHRRTPDAPWPVRRGGWARCSTRTVCCIAFGVLFVGSFVGHALGGVARVQRGAACAWRSSR